MSTNTEQVELIKQTISKINSGRNPADRQNLQEMCLAIISALNGDYNALLNTVNTFTKVNTFQEPIVGDIIGDIYAPNGTTKALENASVPVRSPIYDPATPVLFGRVIETNYRLGAKEIHAGSALLAAIASLQAMWGSLGVQSWDKNNTSLMDNMFLDGNGYRLTRDGTGTLVHFLENEIAFSFAPTGLEGAAAVLTRKVVIGADDLKIGTPTDNYYNCYFPYGGTDYLYSANNTPAFKHSFVDGRYITYYGVGGAINSIVTWLEIGSNPIENYYNCYFDGTDYKYLTNAPAFRHSFINGQYTTYYGTGGAINTVVTWIEQTKISLTNGLETVKDDIAVHAANTATVNGQSGRLTNFAVTIAPSTTHSIVVTNSFCSTTCIPFVSWGKAVTYSSTANLILSAENNLNGTFTINIQNTDAIALTSISGIINFFLV